MNDNNTLIFDFLKRFSSLESALRISSSVKINDNATFDWNDVKKILKKNKFTLNDEQLGFEIIQNPPKTLVFSNEKGLSWDIGKIGSEGQDLVIDVLVRVRNNLFHGSKKFGESSESNRNITLITEALVLLDDVVKSLKMEEAYEDIVEYWN